MPCTRIKTMGVTGRVFTATEYVFGAEQVGEADPAKTTANTFPIKTKEVKLS